MKEFLKKVVYMVSRAIIYIPFLLLFPTKIISKKNVPKKGAYITVSNHLSLFDIPAVGIKLSGYRRFLAKKELGKRGISRHIVSAYGGILIDRQNTDLLAIKKCLEVLKKGQALSIFPEGTRNRGGEDLQAIKKGAAMFAIKAKVQIYPVMILRKTKLFRKNYMLAGKAVELDEFYTQKLDAAALEKAAKIIETRMKETREELIAYVQSRKKNFVPPSASVSLENIKPDSAVQDEIIPPPEQAGISVHGTGSV